MRSFIIMLALIISSVPSWSQFNYTLTGTPVNTTGWSIGGNASVSGNTIVLTNPINSTSGYIYYSTPVNLTGCSQFTVNFEFNVSNSSAPPADGISFWYITNPPSGFVIGGGIGLPSNPVGLTLLLDTYDNDATNNNPLVSMRYLNGTNYVEGSTTGLIGPDVTYQSFITDGTWHSCQLIYNNGNLSVAFDGNPPVITGYYSIAINGYFGFSASTGALYSNHSIRNVSIVGNTLSMPVVTSPITYCQFEQSTALTAIGSNLKWYTTPTGGVGSTIAPIPSTTVAGTQYFYVSQTIPGCGESNRDTIQVIVNPKPTPPTISYQSAYCVGETFIPFTNAPNYLWYTTYLGGVGSPSTPTISTALPDSVTYFVSQTVNGCESDRATIPVKINATPIVSFTYTIKYGCYQDTIVFHNLTTNADSYQWNLGDNTSDTSKNPIHIYASQGVYDVYLKAWNKYGCQDSSEAETINVITRPIVHLYDVSTDTTVLYGDVIQLHSNGADYYTWTPDKYLDYPNTSNPKFTALDSATFQIIGMNQWGCNDTAYVHIDLDYSMFETIPNAFSPNGDGRNDVFKVTHIRYQRITEFKIFNRWGQVVYNDEGNNAGWDGTYGGKPADVGVYQYLIRVETPEGTQRVYKGNVSLIR